MKAEWCYSFEKICVNIGSGNGLLHDGTKPLPEPMLTNHYKGSVAFTCGNFTVSALATNQ